jgi:hypothetical protein
LRFASLSTRANSRSASAARLVAARSGNPWRLCLRR